MTINGDDLIEALQASGNWDVQYYLNTETGAIIMIFDGMVDGEKMEGEEIDEMIEDGPYRQIDPVSSNAAYRVLEGFVDTLPDGQAKRRLEDSLGGKGAFRRFKDRMYDYPELKEQYFRFQELAYRKLALDWLEDNDIVADLTFRALPALEGFSEQ